VPDNSERIGLLSAQICMQFTGCDAKIPDVVSDNAPSQTWDAALKRLMGNLRRTLLQVKARPTRIDIPYETLSTERGKERRVVVLWINDVAIGKMWLSTLAVLLEDVTPAEDKARLRIVGPFDSDKLIDALDDNLTALRDEARNLENAGAAFKRYQTNWKTLTRLQLISPSSTTPAERLRSATQRSADGRVKVGEKKWDILSHCPGNEPARDCINEAFRDRMGGIGVILQKLANGESLDQFEKVEPALPKDIPDPFFVRTIGTDDQQIVLLVQELCARGLGDGGRVVLLREWDSIYARTFAQSLEEKLDCRNPKDVKAPKDVKDSKDVKDPREEARDEQGIKLEVYSYLRGLDGANLDGASKQLRLVPRSGGGDKARDDRNKEPEIEWPESRDQRDYVRRLVRKVQKAADDGTSKDRVRAIGMIGVDVHDKLVLAQALRAAFPDRLLFTTDLDARLMHPEVLEHTRNLVVASTLALVPPFLPRPYGEGEIKVAPFRDVYQTATFLGARYASALIDHRDDIRAELKKDRLFEIGRDGEVELGIEGLPDNEKGKRYAYAVLSLFILLALGWLMLFGRPAPAMKAALAGSDTSFESFDLSTAIVSGLTVAAWGFALAVVIELAVPGLMGPGGTVVLAVASALLFWALVYPGIGAPPAGRANSGVDAARAWVRWQFVGRLFNVLVVALAGWILLAPHARDAGMHEPFAPLSGVSAWPSQLLRTLAILLFAWFVDYAWNGSARAARRIGHKYFAISRPAPPRFRPATNLQLCLSSVRRTWTSDWRWFAGTRWRRMKRALSAASLWFWHPKLVRRDRSVDGARLWRAYLLLLRNGPRVGRLVLWLALTGLVVAVEVFLLVGGGLSEIPARGLGDRALFFATMMISSVGTIILLVLVTNATALAWRFIVILRGGRTVYPSTTVDRFAAALGTELVKDEVKHLYYPVAPHVGDRGKESDKGGRAPRNSLFDAWIDARLLAEYTAAIGPLIVFPFVLLGLQIVVRSRLFDNWVIDGSIVAVLGSYLLWGVAIAALLNFGAEMARRKALESMETDLLWLKGAGDKYEKLAKQFPALIDQVRNLREGAFAPFFEQPLVQAILVPLGGAGGIQLLQMFVFARS